MEVWFLRERYAYTTGVKGDLVRLNDVFVT